jgi:hypothetical protein
MDVVGGTPRSFPHHPEEQGGRWLGHEMASAQDWQRRPQG